MPDEKRRDWLRANWAAPGNIVAGTTLRSYANRELPLRSTPCHLNQVHGTRVVAAANYETPPDADACVAENSDFACVVRTADCVPVLLCSSDGAHFGAAHAGWRGMVAGVIENTVAQLGKDPRKLHAWLGPAISQRRFEVGSEVRQAFVDADSSASTAFEPNDNGRWQADLYTLARQRLAAAGVMRVSGGGFCTYDDSDRFYSYRRNPDCGRMTSFIGRVDP